MTQPVITVSAALILDGEGRLLLVRKRGTTSFMQPGGKPEVGESPAQTLSRELAEEVGLRVPEDALEYLGLFRSAAANEADHVVEAHMFAVPLGAVDAESLAVSAEIEELHWWAPGSTAPYPVAPLVHDHVLALLEARA